LGAPGFGAQDPYLKPAQWELSGSYRYFRSNRFFEGNRPARSAPAARRTQQLWEMGVNYAVDRQWSIYGALPVTDAALALGTGAGGSLDGTRNTGVGDLRLGARKWLRRIPYFRDSSPAWRENLGLGIGIKLPTGDANAKDRFVDLAGNRRLRPVDLGSQPGEGGVGFTLEVQGFKQAGSATLFLSGGYLFNPRNQTGTQSIRASLFGPANVPSNVRFNTVPDHYFFEIGAGMPVRGVPGLAMSLGASVTGVPPSDLLGASDGYRFAGFAVELEPGASFNRGAGTLSLKVPINVYRNAQEGPGLPGRRLVTFAPYQILMSYTHRFPAR
jgi:hypothetical protein